MFINNLIFEKVNILPNKLTTYNQLLNIVSFIDRLAENMLLQFEKKVQQEHAPVEPLRIGTLREKQVENWNFSIYDKRN